MRAAQFWAKAGPLILIKAATLLRRLTGRVTGLRDVRDFSGTYDAIGGGGTWIGGLGGVQLSNGKGVLITLQGVEAGMESAATRSTIRISLR
jgi:hypothetical protein